MIFEDIANVMNARPVKEIMRKTGLTKNRVYSLRMGCTFHMDYELLFALQRMGYEVRVFAVGDPARRSRDGDGKIPAPVGPVTARAVSPQAKRRRKPTSAGVRARGHICAKRKWGSEHVAPGGDNDRPARFRAAKWSRTATRAGVRARGQPWNKGTYPGRPRGKMRGHI